MPVKNPIWLKFIYEAINVDGLCKRDETALLTLRGYVYYFIKTSIWWLR